MPRPDELNGLVHQALVEHVRTWWASDAIYFLKLQRQIKNGVIDPELVRQIARTFFVARNLRSGTENEFAKVLLEFAKDWPSDPYKKIERFSEIAQTWKKTHGVHFVSGISKFIWLAHPKGWTMYDRFAADALEISLKQNTLKRAEDYYRTLYCLQFEELCDGARKELNNHGYEGLFPERVFDKLLMIIGKRGKTDGVQFASKDLPLAIGRVPTKRIEDMAKSISELLSSSRLASRIWPEE